MFWPQIAGDAIVGIVVGKNCAEQRLLCFKVMGRRTKRGQALIVFLDRLYVGGILNCSRHVQEITLNQAGTEGGKDSQPC